MSQWIFINKTFFKPDQARIGIEDSGYQYGDGLFETMPSLGGNIIALQKHLDRLFSSLDFFGYTVDFSKEDVKRWLLATLEKNHLGKRDAYIKIMVSRGGLGPRLSFQTSHQPNIIIIARALSPYPLSHYRHGAKVIKSSIMRTCFSNPCYRHKLLNYFECVYAKNEANAGGALEALFLAQDGTVLEGATSNVFMVHKKHIYTPPLQYNILPGTVRETILQLGQKNQLPVKEEKFGLPQLCASDEAFLTNSLMGIMPVTSIGRKNIGHGKPGPYTRRLMELYQSYLQNPA